MRLSAWTLVLLFCIPFAFASELPGALTSATWSSWDDSDKFAPPWDVHARSHQLITISRAGSGMNTDTPRVEIDLSHTRFPVYLESTRIYSITENRWLDRAPRLGGEQINLPGFRTNSTVSAFLSGDAIRPGEYLFFAYLCPSYSVTGDEQIRLRCGCRSETNCGYWNVQRYIIPDPQQESDPTTSPRVDGSPGEPPGARTPGADCSRDQECGLGYACTAGMCFPDSSTNDVSPDTFSGNIEFVSPNIVRFTYPEVREGEELQFMQYQQVSSIFHEYLRNWAGFMSSRPYYHVTQHVSRVRTPEMERLGLPGAFFAVNNQAGVDRVYVFPVSHRYGELTVRPQNLHEKLSDDQNVFILFNEPTTTEQLDERDAIHIQFVDEIGLPVTPGVVERLHDRHRIVFYTEGIRFQTVREFGNTQLEVNPPLVDSGTFTFTYGSTEIIVEITDRFASDRHDATDTRQAHEQRTRVAACAGAEDCVIDQCMSNYDCPIGNYCDTRRDDDGIARTTCVPGVMPDTCSADEVHVQYRCLPRLSSPWARIPSKQPNGMAADPRTPRIIQYIRTGGDERAYFEGGGYGADYEIFVRTINGQRSGWHTGGQLRAAYTLRMNDDAHPLAPSVTRETRGEYQTFMFYRGPVLMEDQNTSMDFVRDARRGDLTRDTWCEWLGQRKQEITERDSERGALVPEPPNCNQEFAHPPEHQCSGGLLDGTCIRGERVFMACDQACSTGGCRAGMCQPQFCLTNDDCDGSDLTCEDFVCVRRSNFTDEANTHIYRVNQDTRHQWGAPGRQWITIEQRYALNSVILDGIDFFYARGRCFRHEHCAEGWQCEQPWDHNFYYPGRTTTPEPRRCVPICDVHWCTSRDDTCIGVCLYDGTCINNARFRNNRGGAGDQSTVQAPLASLDPGSSPRAAVGAIYDNFVCPHNAYRLDPPYSTNSYMRCYPNDEDCQWQEWFDDRRDQLPQTGQSLTPPPPEQFTRTPEPEYDPRADPGADPTPPPEDPPSTVVEPEITTVSQELTAAPALTRVNDGVLFQARITRDGESPVEWRWTSDVASSSARTPVQDWQARDQDVFTVDVLQRFSQSNYYRVCIQTRLSQVVDEACATIRVDPNNPIIPPDEPPAGPEDEDTRLDLIDEEDPMLPGWGGELH